MCLINIGVHDEIKISWLQAQLQLEKQQRLMDTLEYKLESNLGEVSRKVDQVFQYVEKSVDELKQQQKLLMNRQDQLFNKQDQIHSTLTDDSVSVTSYPAMTWPSLQNQAPMSSGMKYGSELQSVAGGCLPPLLPPIPRMSQPQSTASDVESFNISDTDLESLLSFDWECPKVCGKETNPMQTPTDYNAAKGESACEDSAAKQVFVDLKIIIQNNSRYCNENDVGKVAAALARDSFFGVDVLRKSTLSGGHGQQALDKAKISSLLSVIHNDSAFCKLSKEEFSKAIKPKVIGAIRHQCKYWRAKQKRQ